MLTRPHPQSCTPRRPGHRLQTLRIRLLVALVGLVLTGCGGSQPAPPLTADTPAKTTRPKPKRSAPQPTRDVADASHTPDPSTTPSSTTPDTPVVQTIHRPDDNRPRRDDQRLAKLGFQKVAAERLILYSDLPAGELADLPDAVQQLYAVLEAYFGPLPPARNQAPYQMTAYLMGDTQRFKDAGIFTEGPAQPHEGWYLGNEFWWNRQATPYYTRHLMLHEATHCFMHVVPAVDCPPWYVEGMAELFGTHYRDEQGQFKFGILPDGPDRNPGWARISVLQDQIAAGKLRDVDEILKFQFDDFSQLPPYAWSWAFCHFLNNHPRYQVPFRQLARRVLSGGFTAQATELFAPLLPDLRDEWLLFAAQIQYGHNLERSAITFISGQELPAGQTSPSVQVAANAGWQSSQVAVQAGRKYRVRATGQFTLADRPKPWVSEPQGISIRYFAGQPLGRLMGAIRPAPISPPTPQSPRREILNLIPLGPDATFTAPHSGTLYLRLNDAWNEIGDNSGTVQVEIEAQSAK